MTSAADILAAVQRADAFSGTVPDLPKADLVAVKRASAWLPDLHDQAMPGISANCFGEIVAEWSSGVRTLTVYFERNQTHVLCSCGPDMTTDMADGVVESVEELKPLFVWLADKHGGLPKFGRVEQEVKAMRIEFREEISRVREEAGMQASRAENIADPPESPIFHWMQAHADLLSVHAGQYVAIDMSKDRVFHDSSVEALIKQVNDAGLPLDAVVFDVVGKRHKA